MPATTPNEALLDVNLLVASIFEDHLHHVRALAFIDGLQRVYTSPTTQGGFLRFATRPWKNQQRQEQPPRLSMEEAQTKLREIIEHPRHVFLADDVSFTDIPLHSMTGHRQWTDAYLLMLAQKHSLTFASLEGRLANLDDAKQPVLFIVS